MPPRALHSTNRRPAVECETRGGRACNPRAMSQPLAVRASIAVPRQWRGPRDARPHAGAAVRRRRRGPSPAAAARQSQQGPRSPGGAAAHYRAPSRVRAHAAQLSRRAGMTAREQGTVSVARERRGPRERGSPSHVARIQINVVRPLAEAGARFRGSSSAHVRPQDAASSFRVQSVRVRCLDSVRHLGQRP